MMLPDGKLCNLPPQMFHIILLHLVLHIRITVTPVKTEPAGDQLLCSE